MSPLGLGRLSPSLPEKIQKLLVPVAAARCYASGIGGRRVRMRDGVSRLRGTQDTGEHND